MESSRGNILPYLEYLTLSMYETRKERNRTKEEREQKRNGNELKRKRKKRKEMKRYARPVGGCQQHRIPSYFSPNHLQFNLLLSIINY